MYFGNMGTSLPMPYLPLSVLRSIFSSRLPFLRALSTKLWLTALTFIVIAG